MKRSVIGVGMLLLVFAVAASLRGRPTEDDKKEGGKTPAPGGRAVTAGTEGKKPMPFGRGARATDGPGGVTFNDSPRFVDPSKLRVVHASAARLARTDSDLTGYLDTVSVTPDGKVTRKAASKETVDGFKELLKAFERTDAPATKGDDDRISPDSVIGADTRNQVTSTTGYPHRTVGRIDLGCTGTLVGPRHVLTAGHCVYDTDNDQWYSQLNFSPGQNGSSRPYGTIAWKRALSVTGWTQNHNRDFDYAMIILNEDAGTNLGTMAFGYNDSLPAHNININGYPADKDYGTMWHSFGKLQLLQPMRLYHDADTYGGNSGSGMYVYDTATNGRVIYGVHAYGVDGTGYNGATRINKTVYDTINQWIADN